MESGGSDAPSDGGGPDDGLENEQRELPERQRDRPDGEAASGSACRPPGQAYLR